MTLVAYTDGASRGNPGESGIGVVLKDESGSVVAARYGYIGRTTNNVAEYTALAVCLKLAQKMECKNLIVHSDSELMVRQLIGEYKVKNEAIKKHYRNIQKLLTGMPFQFEIRHIPRNENREADQLANRGIDTRKRIRV